MKRRPVVVVDTNVVVSGLLTSQPDSATCQILDGMLSGRFSFLLSEALLSEYRRVLLRPRIARVHKLADEEVDQILTELAANALFQEPESAGHAPDRGDDHLFALLATFDQALLVTGDQLLIDNPPEGAAVMTPREFVSRLDR